MTKIVTITLHPTIDKFFTVHQLLPNSKLHVNDYIRKAGGGGINVSKILAKHQVPSTAIYACGGYNTALLQELLKQDNIDGVSIPSLAECRENIIINVEQNDDEYRFNMPLKEHEESVYDAIVKKLTELEVPEIVVISGSFGNGFSLRWYDKIYQWAQLNQIKVMIDSKAEVLKQIMIVGAYLIKPNRKEFIMALGKEKLTNDEILSEANAIIRAGKIQHILISMGSEGAYLINHSGATFYKRIPVHAVNSVGAGDSLLAGVVFGIERGESIEDAVQYGIQCAAATVINSKKTMFEWDDMKKVQALL